MSDVKSEVRKQDHAGKQLAGKVELDFDRIRQMVDAIGDLVHGQEGRLVQVVKE